MTPSRIRLLGLCCGLLVLTGCLDDELPLLDQNDYKISGLSEEKETESYIQGILDDRLSQKTDSNPEDKARVEIVREEDIKADLLKGMKAKGYYDAEIDYADDAAKPKTGTYDIASGKQYRISSIHIEPAAYETYLSGLEIKAGDPLDAEAVLKAQAALYVNAQKDKCHFGFDVTHGVRLDDKVKTGALVFTITAGAEATFGAVLFQGQKTVDQSYLKKLIPFREGRCYRADRVERLRTRLMESGLFSRADVVLPEAPDANGKVNLIVNLKERAQRTVKAGLSYYTDEGPGATFGWEHRNFFGSAEKVTADLTLSQIKQSLEAEFLKPYFILRSQTLTANASIVHEDTDAYDNMSINGGVGVTRKINRHLDGTLGVQTTISRIKDHTENTENTYGLVSAPGTLSYDNRDDKLNPHKGWYINGLVSPYFDVLGESDPFLKAQFGASTYFDFGTPYDVVLALRGTVGSIMGAATDSIPATERFYAGGGGTVRGFAYQDIGPKNADGDPEGGSSLVTGSAELRFKFTETIGGVTFVDVGSVTDTAYPDFDNLAVGAGVGVRYYTGFGPVRFDVAVPVTQKDESDAAFQVYISIGQAF